MSFLSIKEACTLSVDTPLTESVPDYFSVNNDYITPNSKDIILKIFDSKGSEVVLNRHLHRFYIVINYDTTNSKRYATKVV
ncbi:MAG: hypothetical protein ABJK28_03025 [Algibacter sp.]